MATLALNSPRDYAVYFAQELGFSVFVLRNPEADTEIELKNRKKPAVNWDLFQIMRPSKKQIERWFSQNPKYNLAAACGRVSNLIAIDIDGDEAKKRFEDKQAEMSTNLFVAVKNTMINKTGSGGFHVFFKFEEPIDLRGKVIWTGPGEHCQIRMQANGTYIVLPPSIHPNGKHYEWNGKQPKLITMQELKEFIRLVGNDSKLEISAVDYSQQEETESDSEGANSGEIVEVNARPLSADKMKDLYGVLHEYYTPGNRDYVVFHLSGMMRKDGGFSLEDTKSFFMLLWKQKGYPDEDIAKSLDVIENTYKKPLSQINGKKGLHEMFVLNYECNDDMTEYLKRADSYSRICQIVNNQGDENNNSSSRKAYDDGNDDDDDDHNYGDNDNNNHTKKRRVTAIAIPQQRRRESLPMGCLMMELTNRSPETYTAVMRQDDYHNPTTNTIRPLRVIQEIGAKRVFDSDGNLVEIKYDYKQIVLSAIPVPPIEVIYDPLFDSTKYRMKFEHVGPGGKVAQTPEPIGPFTKSELVDYLIEKTDWVYKKNMLDDALRQVINGYCSREGMSQHSIEIETEGLIWLNNENRLVLSKWPRYRPTPQEARQCIDVIHNLQREFYPADRGIERKRFAHFIKIGIVSPVDFARRQIGAVGSYDIIPRQDLAGWSNSGKSYGYAGLALRIFRLPLHGKTKYVIGSGSIDSEARIIEQTRGTTMPVIFDDADFLTDWVKSNEPRAKRCLSLIKNGAEMTNPRDTLTSDSRRRNLPMCAYPMFTHNSDLINEDGFVRRATSHEFTKEDTKTKEQMIRYDEFFKLHGHTFGFLGDFATYYYLEHPEILFNDWPTIARTIIRAFYEYAEIPDEEIPEWLLYEVVESATSHEGLAETRTSNIAAALHDMVINQGWSRNKRDCAIWIGQDLRNTLPMGEVDYETGLVKQNIDEITVNAMMDERVKAVIMLNYVPHIKWHPDKQICIMASVIEELKRRGISRVSHKQLASYLNGSKYGPVWLGDKHYKTVYLKLRDFVALINPGQQQQPTVIQTKIQQ